jgi:RNA polymerase sigma-70 factor (ECF subfamily)
MVTRVSSNEGAPMNERQLIDRLILKDERAFYTLYHMYHPLVYYVILQMLQHKDNASEVTQDVFLSIYQKIETYRGGNFKFWILQIAKNAARNFLTRVASKEKKIIKDDEYVFNLASKDYSIGGTYDDLLEHFPNETVDIIIYKAVFEFSFDHIAQLLNMNKTYVFRTYQNALPTLKAILKGE